MAPDASRIPAMAMLRDFMISFFYGGFIWRCGQRRTAVTSVGLREEVFHSHAGDPGMGTIQSFWIHDCILLYIKVY